MQCSAAHLSKQGEDHFAHADGHQTYRAQPFQYSDIKAILVLSVLPFLCRADFLQNLAFQLDIFIPVWQEKEDFAERWLGSSPFSANTLQECVTPLDKCNKILHRHGRFQIIISWEVTWNMQSYKSPINISLVQIFFGVTE